MQGRWLALALLAWPLGNAEGAPKPRVATVLVPAPAARGGAALVQGVCPRLAVPCDPASTKAWIAKGARNGPLYLIDASKPMLVALDGATPDRVEAAHEWDFHDYSHSHPMPGGSSDVAGLELYPALYPVGEHGLAVALISRFVDMYAGGGASFSVADFVTLGTSAQRVFTAVPFACGKLIRACFSEEDYRTSLHCHDEWTGHLTIRYGSSGIQSFVWQEEVWPQNQKTTQHTATPFHADLESSETLLLPAGVSFCDFQEVE